MVSSEELPAAPPPPAAAADLGDLPPPVDSVAALVADTIIEPPLSDVDGLARLLHEETERMTRDEAWRSMEHLEDDSWLDDDSDDTLNERDSSDDMY